jgi:hypothetical protein
MDWARKVWGEFLQGASYLDRADYLFFTTAADVAFRMPHKQ